MTIVLPGRRSVMSERRPVIRILPAAGLKQDLQTLHDAALKKPQGPEGRLLRVALNQLARIQQGAPGTHPLGYMPSHPDLSDCETTCVGADPNAKPSHRIVWRERAPQRPGEPVIREIIALGERANGQAYYMAGQRLVRPPCGLHSRRAGRAARADCESLATQAALDRQFRHAIHERAGPPVRVTKIPVMPAGITGIFLSAGYSLSTTRAAAHDPQ
ncbi:hypothetical protein ACFXB4_22180 [Streptomyces lavendulae]|uniref:hypothetical protein n=1 Tax=Streptomyces lavendulae TaxID=1914 RepID=UPI00367FEBCE